MAFSLRTDSGVSSTNGIIPYSLRGGVRALSLEEEIDLHLSSMPPQPAITKEEIRRKNELTVEYGDYLNNLRLKLVEMKVADLVKLKDHFIEIITDTENRTIKIYNKNQPLHINGRIGASMLLREIYECLPKRETRREDLEKLIALLDDNNNFPIYGTDSDNKLYHRDTLENSLLLKSNIAKLLAKNVVNLESPLPVQFNLVLALKKLSSEMKEEVLARPKFFYSDNFEPINRALFIALYFYNKNAAEANSKVKDGSKKLELISPSTLEELSTALQRSPGQILERENLQP